MPGVTTFWWPTTGPARRLLAVVATGLLTVGTLAIAAPASAATHAWIGATGGLWSEPTNWNGGVPTTGESGGATVIFNGNSESRPDIANLVVSRIELRGNNNVIANDGVRLGLRAGLAEASVVNSGNGNAINAPLGIDGAGLVTFVSSSATSTLVVGGVISGNSSTEVHFEATSGALGTTLTGANTYTGRFFVDSGVVRLGNAQANKAYTGPQIVVGGATAAPVAPVLRLAQPIQIGEDTDIRVRATGTLDTDGKSESFRNLVVDGGQVTSASGNLQLWGKLTMVGGSVTMGTGRLFLGDGSGFSADPGDDVDGGLDMIGGSISGTGPQTVFVPGSKGTALSDLAMTSGPAGPAVISGTVVLDGPHRFLVADGPTSDIDASITRSISDAPTGTAGRLVKDGAGTLSLSPSSRNTYTAGTRIDAGTLIPNGSAETLPTAGKVTVGGFALGAAPARLLLKRVGELPSGSTVLIQPSGEVSTGGLTQTVTAVDIVGGKLDLGASGSFFVNGKAEMFGGRVTGQGKFSPWSVVATAAARIEAPMLLNASTTFEVSADPLKPELTVAGGIELSGTGASTLIKSGDGTMDWRGTNFVAGYTSVQGGTVQMQGTTPAAACATTSSGQFCGPTNIEVAVGGRLTGNGAVGELTATGSSAGGGVVSPSPAGLTVAGGAGFFGRSSLQPQVGPTGTLGRLIVKGTVTLDPLAALVLPTGFTAPAATTHTVIDNDGVDLLTGVFVGVAQGQPLTSGHPFTASYKGGDGNDLVLTSTVAPTPTPVPPTLTPVPPTPVAPTPTAPTPTPTPDVGSVETPAPTPAPLTPGLPTATPAPANGAGTPSTASLAKLTFTVSKNQRLSAKGTFSAKAGCVQACTVTLVTSVKIGGKGKPKSATTTVELNGATPSTIQVAVPKAAVSAVRTALKRRQKVSVTVVATAKDSAGRAATPITTTQSLRR